MDDRRRLAGRNRTPLCLNLNQPNLMMLKILAIPAIVMPRTIRVRPGVMPSR